MAEGSGADVGSTIRWQQVTMGPIAMASACGHEKRPAVVSKLALRNSGFLQHVQWICIIMLNARVFWLGVFVMASLRSTLIKKMRQEGLHILSAAVLFSS